MEEDDRLAAAARVQVRGRNGHAVERRAPLIVCPPGHHVAQVDHKRARHGLDVEPLASASLHLEPAGRVLCAQDRHTAVVGVGAGAELARFGLAFGRRVVDDANARGVVAELVLEPVLGQVEREREQPAQPPAEPRDRLVVLLEQPPQAGWALGPAVARHGRAPVERLLQVGRSSLAEARGQALATERPVGGEAERRLALG